MRLEKKVLRTGFEYPSRIADEIPIAPLSASSATGTREFDFRHGPVLPSGGSSSPDRDEACSPRRRERRTTTHGVWSLEKRALRSHRTKRSGRQKERERSLSAIKRKRKKERDKQERKDSGITRREGLPLVPRSLDSYGDLRLANGAFCLANYLSAVFDFRNILCARRIILRPVARCRDDNSRHRSDRSGRARVSIRLF